MTTAAAIRKSYYTVDDVCDILSKSRRQIYRYIDTGALRAVRPAGTRTWLVAAEELEDFIHHSNSTSPYERAKEAIEAVLSELGSDERMQLAALLLQA